MFSVPVSGNVDIRLDEGEMVPPNARLARVVRHEVTARGRGSLRRSVSAPDLRSAAPRGGRGVAVRVEVPRAGTLPPPGHERVQQLGPGAEGDGAGEHGGGGRRGGHVAAAEVGGEVLRGQRPRPAVEDEGEDGDDDGEGGEEEDAEEEAVVVGAGEADLLLKLVLLRS